MRRRIALFVALLVAMLVMAGLLQSWNVALAMLNMGLISAILAIGLNIQWGYSGLFNVGVMGFVAMGGLAVIIVSAPPVGEAWRAGGNRIVIALLLAGAALATVLAIHRRMRPGVRRTVVLIAFVLASLVVFRAIFDPAVSAIEAVNPTQTGYLGGAGLPVLLSWPIGAGLAAIAAYAIGRIALGLRADYLAIATLGIAEILIVIMKNEEWLTRGVKNVIGLPRPVPYEIDLQRNARFLDLADRLGVDAVNASSIFVKICYASMFLAILVVVLVLAERALHSPWGRMMRAIRDDETAAAAMGKDIAGRHLQVFVIGSALFGLAGAMMTTLDGQFTPTSFQPLRYTFLVWVMVIAGGAGNNWGAAIGGMLIWMLWIEAEPIGHLALNHATAWLGDDNAIRAHLVASAAHMRMIAMGCILLLIMRFNPRGLVPGR